MSEIMSTELTRYNSVVIKQPRLADPATLYKAGEEPRRVHRIDIAGWLANGWSEEPVTEPEPQPEPEPEPPKRATRKKPADETE